MQVRMLLVISLAMAGVSAAGQPRISFEQDRVVAEGIIPGAQVAWFSVAREPAPFQAAMIRREAVVTDTTGAGSVSFDLGQDVPACSIWVAVDLASGELEVAAPPSEPLREVTLPPGAFRSAPSGKLARLVQATHLLEVFVARPGAGAWVGTLTDQEDPDLKRPSHGQVSIALERLQPVGATAPAPDEFLA
ncbi:MAG: hypothetical protein V1750_02020, partial [Acidobacteriota bacterium]